MDRVARDRARDATRRLSAARARTDAVFACLEPSSFLERPIPERHRPVFYLGHVDAFDWNLLGRQALGLPSFHPTFDRLFAFGIDPLDSGLPEDRPADWPSLSEIDAYRLRARSALDAGLAAAHLADPTALEIAIEHRLMHAETLAYMLACLPARGLRAPQPAGVRAGGSGRDRRGAHVDAGGGFATVPAGVATLGRRREDPGFGWDNEFGEEKVEVGAFRIARHNVTNREFLGFVAAGCYQERSLWRKEDWAWREAQGLAFPVRWRQRRGQWWQRRVFEEVPLEGEEPVQVSFAEASAFAAWRGMRLPSEAEYHRAAYGTPSGGERRYPWGSDEPRALHHGNFGFLRWNPQPVGSHPAGDSAFGIADLASNGWEWTLTPFQPFSGFAAHPLYPGYSRDFFDGRHHVLKGASARTDLVFLRRSFRNWFQPHYPHVFAGFRLVGAL